MKPPTVPPEPLLSVAEVRARAARTDGTFPRSEASAAELADLLGVSARTVQRWRKGGALSVFVADVLALRLNLHPVNVWGSTWP